MRAKLHRVGARRHRRFDGRASGRNHRPRPETRDSLQDCCWRCPITSTTGFHLPHLAKLRVRYDTLRRFCFRTASLQCRTRLTITPSRDGSLFGRLRSSIGDMPRMTMMPGFHGLDEFTGNGHDFGSGDYLLRVGHAKLMVTATSGRQTPSYDELCQAVSQCAAYGFPVAIHAVERETIISAAESIRFANTNTGTAMRHRIEHCSEGTPDAIQSVVRSSAWVVTQPGFIHSQRRPLSEVGRTVDDAIISTRRRACPRRSSAWIRIGRARVGPESDARAPSGGNTFDSSGPYSRA